MSNFRGIFSLVLCLNLCFIDSQGTQVRNNLLYGDSTVLHEKCMYSFPEKQFLPLSDVENCAVLFELVSTLKDQDTRIKRLDEFNKKLLDKIDQLEQQIKVNNLIFTNVQESKHENHRSSEKKVLHIVNNVMKTRTRAEDISVALRVDGDNATDEARPIVVRFTNFATKMRVMAARNKLKHSKVEVSADYSELVKEKRKELLPFLLEKRALGHDAFILYDKLMVDGVKVTLEDLKAERKEEEEKVSESDLPEEVPTTESVDVRAWPEEVPTTESVDVRAWPEEVPTPESIDTKWGPGEVPNTETTEERGWIYPESWDDVDVFSQDYEQY